MVLVSISTIDYLERSAFSSSLVAMRQLVNWSVIFTILGLDSRLSDQAIISWIRGNDTCQLPLGGHESSRNDGKPLKRHQLFCR